MHPVRKLIVTVHHGTNLSAKNDEPLAVTVQCGAFEGQTAKVLRGAGTRTTWDELFEFPYPDDAEMRVLLVNDAAPMNDKEGDRVAGGVVIPKEAVMDVTRGDEESVPVMTYHEMNRSFDEVKEGPLGNI